MSELPHRTVDLFGERREDFPYVDLLAGSPGLSLLADALARVPGTGIPTITDEHPLVAPPSPPEEEGATGLGSLFTLGIVLLTVGAVALRRRVV